MAFDSALMLNSDCPPALGGKILLLTAVENRIAVDDEVLMLRNMLCGADQEFTALFTQLLDTIDTTKTKEVRYLSIGGGPLFEFPGWGSLRVGFESHAARANLRTRSMTEAA